MVSAGSPETPAGDWFSRDAWPVVTEYEGEAARVTAAVWDVVDVAAPATVAGIAMAALSAPSATSTETRFTSRNPLLERPRPWDGAARKVRKACKFRADADIDPLCVYVSRVANVNGMCLRGSGRPCLVVRGAESRNCVCRSANSTGIDPNCREMVLEIDIRDSSGICGFVPGQCYARRA